MKSTGSNFGCALRCEFSPHSFSQSSSEGTVTSAFVPQSGTTAGQVGVFRAGTVVVWVITVLVKKMCLLV
jgi:hypothetical protein